jgi:hypothetical protein
MKKGDVFGFNARNAWTISVRVPASCRWSLRDGSGNRDRPCAALPQHIDAKRDKIGGTGELHDAKGQWERYEQCRQAARCAEHLQKIAEREATAEYSTARVPPSSPRFATA